MNRIKALKRIEGLTPEALADALGDNGFSSCRQLVIDKEIDGKQFLGITEYQTKQFKQYLKPGELQRLWFFIVRINEHPEEFVIGDAEYLNINSAPTKKTLSESSYKLPPPLPPSSSYNLPPPTPSSHNSPSPIIPAQKPTQLPKPSSNIPKPPLTKNQRPVNILPKPTMPMPSFNSGKSIPPPPLSNSRKPPSSNLNSGSKLPPPPPLNIFSQPPPVNTSSKLPPPPPSSNSSRPPPPPLSNSSRPLPPVSNSSRTPPPPPLSNSSKTPPPPPLSNSSRTPPPPPLTYSSKPPPPPLINSAKPTLPTPKILLPPTIPISTNPSPSPLLSPSVDIIESLRDNIRNKFKNAIPESDDSDSPEDWYEDEDLPAAPAPYQETEEEFYMNYDNAHGAEMENERQRRKSSEEFMANRLKLEMHLKGHRTDDGEEENKAKATAIYVNIEELKLEQEKTTVHSPPKFDLKELQSKIKVTEPEIDVPPPAPKRPNQNLITPQRKVSDDRNKQRTLPQPPVNLPNILLGVPPQRPPKNENSARKGDQSPMNASKFHSESSLVNEEGTYEPPPHVNDIPNSLKTFIEMDHLRQARNNPETIAQEGDYLIPNEVLQNKGSIFTKQYVPLPPIPTPPMHEDELYRSEYFQNITNRDVASKMFESKPVGHFFLRPSKNYSCTLMIKGERKILNVPVLYEGYRYKLLADTSESIAEETFMTLNDLVEYYQSHPIMVKKTRVLLRSWK